jgi:hypothetical protein
MLEYVNIAREAAADAVQNFDHAVVEQILEKGEASNDLHNDYDDGDSYHSETHQDTGYNLRQAAQLLEELSEFEETDAGLWGDANPRRAIDMMAGYTFGNAVLSYFRELIELINTDDDVQGLYLEYQELAGTCDHEDTSAKEAKHIEETQMKPKRLEILARIKAICDGFYKQEEGE